MTLKLTLKPGERLYVGQAEIRVAVPHIVNVIVDGDAPVLRAEDHLHEMEAVTLGLELRYLIQQMYLTGDSAALSWDYFRQAQLLRQSRPDVAELLAQITGLLLQGHAYKAIKLAKALGEVGTVPSNLRLVQGE